MTLALTSRRAALAPGPWVRNELWRRARAVPSLDLRFAENKSLVDATTGSNLVTFTRASDGTFVDSAGVIQTATTDVPRFDHNPTTGESLGLLVEEQRTNLVQYSQAFDDAWWGKASASILAVSGTSPSGSSTIYKFIPDLDAGALARISSTAITKSATATAYTFSAFVKAAEFSLLRFFAFETGNTANRVEVTFNATTEATTGAVTAGTFSGRTFSFVPLGNGWYRCSLGFTTGTETSITLRLTGSQSELGDGTSGIYLWGAQLEAGAFPTSYIPTTTAAVTRSADVCSISGSNFSSWYRQDEGTVFAEFGVIGSTGATQPALQFNNGTDGTRIMIIRRGDAKAGLNVAVSNVASCDLDSNVTFAVGSIGKTASVYKLDDFAIVANASSAVVDTSGSVPTNDRANIGSRILGTYLNGPIRRIVFWPRRLGNEVLQGITQ